MHVCLWVGRQDPRHLIFAKANSDDYSFFCGCHSFITLSPTLPLPICTSFVSEENEKHKYHISLIRCHGYLFFISLPVFVWELPLYFVLERCGSLIVHTCSSRYCIRAVFIYLEAPTHELWLNTTYELYDGFCTPGQTLDFSAASYYATTVRRC